MLLMRSKVMSSATPTLLSRTCRITQLAESLQLVDSKPLFNSLAKIQVSFSWTCYLALRQFRQCRITPRNIPAFLRDNVAPSPVAPRISRTPRYKSGDKPRKPRARAQIKRRPRSALSSSCDGDMHQPDPVIHIS